MDTKYVHLRFHIGGILVSEVGPAYIGGEKEYAFNVDIDHLSIPEIIDYCRDFGVTNIEKIYIGVAQVDNLVELVKDRDLLVLANMLVAGGTMDIYICHKGEVLIKTTHTNESLETTSNEADRPNKESTNKVSEGLNALLGKKISLIDGRNQIVGVQQSNMIENDSRNTNEAEDEFQFSSEDEDSEEDEAETIVHSDAESDENDDFSSDEDGYGSDIHEELSTVKKDLKSYLKKNKEPKRKKKVAECFLGEVGIDPGFEDIDKPKKKFTGNIVGDEPFYDSSDADSFDSDSEGEIDVEKSDILRTRKKDKRVSYDPTWSKVVWQLNMVFENVKKFREALSKYAIERGCQLEKIHNDQRRVRVKCKANGCPWILYASKDFKSSDFIIKTYNPRHKCYRTNTNTMCNSKFLAKYYKTRIVSQPCIKGWKIQDLARTDMGLYVGKFVCLKARKMVLKKIMGDHIAEFSRIYDYRDMLLESNPGSTCVVKVTNCDNGKKLFHSFYICFSALKKGFIESCRKCIGLDGCFLKGISKGQLLVAIAKDGNNQMFPIAWAVVGTESRETWTWFLRILKSDLDINDEGEGLTIISDMQKGLYLAVQELLPECEQRMCARHIFANWSKNWKGVEKRKRFWACARSTFEAELRKNLDKLSQLGEDISNDLVNFNPNRWSKAQFRTSSKCDSVDNNMAESFNAWVLGARHKTIVSMLEEIRKKVMNRFTKVITFVNSWSHDISPMAMLVLNTNVKKSMRVEISWNGDIGYEVKDSPYIHVVNLIQGTCTCRSWGLKGIPCAHAIAAIHHNEANLLDSVCKWYKKKTYLKAYKHFLQPVTNMKMWPETSNSKVEPPPVRKMPGRPGKKRKKELGEVPSSGKLPKRGKTMTCSACKSKGHNIRTCPNKPAATSEGIATSQTSVSSKRSGKQKSHPTQAMQQSESSESVQAIVQSGSGNIKGANDAFKRPRVVGHGVFVSKDGFICAEQGRSISRVIKSGAQEKLISSAVVTGDLGYAPSKGLKWKGKNAITGSQLQHKSALLRQKNIKSQTSSQGAT